MTKISIQNTQIYSAARVATAYEARTCFRERLSDKSITELQFRNAVHDLHRSISHMGAWDDFKDLFRPVKKSDLLKHTCNLICAGEIGARLHEENQVGKQNEDYSSRLNNCLEKMGGKLENASTSLEWMTDNVKSFSTFKDNLVLEKLGRNFLKNFTHLIHVAGTFPILSDLKIYLTNRETDQCGLTSPSSIQTDGPGTTHPKNGMFGAPSEAMAHCIGSSDQKLVPSFQSEETVKLGRTRLVTIESGRVPAPTPQMLERAPTLDPLEYRIVVGDVGPKLDKELEDAEKGVKEGHNFGFQAEKIPDANFNLNEGRYSIGTDVDYKTINNVGVAFAQGRRGSMEDTHIATRFDITMGNSSKSIVLQGVFDGHAGPSREFDGVATANFARDNIVDCLRARLHEFNSLEITETGVFNALKLAMVDLSRKKDFGSGTTANVSILIDRDLYIANVGDSRAILVTPDQTRQLSEDAKPHPAKYRKGIEKRGGHVVSTINNNFRVAGRVNGRLATARALGDHEYAGVVSSRPKITRIRLTDEVSKGGWYLAHICDGITDVASSEQIGALIRSNAKEGASAAQIASNLVVSSYKSKSSDNLSALIVPLNGVVQVGENATDQKPLHSSGVAESATPDLTALQDAVSLAEKWGTERGGPGNSDSRISGKAAPEPAIMAARKGSGNDET